MPFERFLRLALDAVSTTGHTVARRIPRVQRAARIHSTRQATPQRAASGRWVAVLLTLCLPLVQPTHGAPLENPDGRVRPLRPDSDLIPVNADEFVPACAEAAPGLKLRDPEFDQQELLVTWQKNPVVERDGTVLEPGWLNIAPIDQLTGEFLLAQTESFYDANPVRITFVNNGPEWGYSQRGPEVFWTAYSPDETTTRIGKLARNQIGRWKVSFLPDSRRGARPEPSKNPLDPVPAIYYSTMKGRFGEQGPDPSKGNFGWRQDTGIPFDITLPSDFGTGRWLPDSTRLFHHLAVTDDVGHIAIYDTLSEVDSLVIPNVTWYIGLGAWSAPELSGATALLAATGNADKVRIDLLVFREDTDGTWKLWTAMKSIDPRFQDISSPEAFVYGGRSYVLLTSRTRISQHLTTASIIWVATVDPDLPEDQRVKRIISQEFLPEVTAKADPELLVLPGGDVKVYYLDKGLPNDPLLICDTGLLP